MNEEEKKLYEIIRSRFCKMYVSFSSYGDPDATSAFIKSRNFWTSHISHHLKAKFTALRKIEPNKFYVIDPASEMRKPYVYIEIDRDVALRILALGCLP